MPVKAESQNLNPDPPDVQSSPGSYFNLAMLAFALLGLELVLVLLEQILPLDPGSVGTAVTHWVLTTVCWVGGTAALWAWGWRRTDFARGRGVRRRGGGLRWGVIAALVVSTWIGQWALRGGVLPPMAEYAALVERFPEWGPIAWGTQVIYYFAEVAVVTTIIAFGQRAGDLWFGRPWVPWGGIPLALTWGLIHFLTQDSATGIYGVLLSLVMGTIFLLTSRRVRLTYLILAAVFIL